MNNETPKMTPEEQKEHDDTVEQLKSQIGSNSSMNIIAERTKQSMIDKINADTTLSLSEKQVSIKKVLSGVRIRE
jgi:hypothetical protein